MKDIYITWEDYHKKIEQLAKKVHEDNWKFNQVICIAKGGLRVGDVILKVDEKKINSANDIIRVIDEGLYKVGDKVHLKILRESRSFELQLILEEPKSQWWGF